MSSNLKVNSLVPATGTEIGIGTTGGSIDFRCPATFGGNVTIGGTLTYDEVINIDSIGIVTARGGVRIPNDTGTIVMGTGSDLSLYHDGSNSFLTNTTGRLDVKSTSYLYLESDDRVYIGDVGMNEVFALFKNDDGVELNFNNTKRFETTNHGTITTGIHTVTVGTDLDGYKVEEGNSDTSTALSGEFDFELENGHVQRYSTATGGNYFPDFRVSSSQSLDSVMDIGDVVSVTLMVASSSHYCTTGIKIDNSTSNLDIDWIGGAAPSAANGSGYDIYAFTIQKTGAAPAYHIIGNALGAA